MKVSKMQGQIDNQMVTNTKMMSSKTSDIQNLQKWKTEMIVMYRKPDFGF